MKSLQSFLNSVAAFIAGVALIASQLLFAVCISFELWLRDIVFFEPAVWMVIALIGSVALFILSIRVSSLTGFKKFVTYPVSISVYLITLYSIGALLLEYTPTEYSGIMDSNNFFDIPPFGLFIYSGICYGLFKTMKWISEKKEVAN